MLKVVSIWARNLDEAHTLINRHELGDRFVQFIDDPASRAYWVVFRLSLCELRDLIEAAGNPRLTVKV